MTTIQIPTALPTAQVTLTTAAGQKFFTTLEISAFIKSQAADLIDASNDVTRSIWAMADRMADVLGDDLAGQFLLAWADSSKKEDSYTRTGCRGGLYAAFVWGESRQGHEFWADVYEALEKIANS